MLAQKCQDVKREHYSRTVVINNIKGTEAPWREESVFATLIPVLLHGQAHSTNNEETEAQRIF